jgi:hypothetical protein
MVGAAEDGRARAVPVDEVHLPEGVVGVERDGEVLLHVVLQRGVVVPAREGCPVEVPSQVEVIVVDPVRPPQESTGRLDPLPEHRVPRQDAGLEEPGDLRPVRRLAEEQDRHDDHAVLRPVHGQPDRVQRGDGPAVRRRGHDGLPSSVSPPA